ANPMSLLTELHTIIDVVAIKMSLLRSVFLVLQTSKLKARQPGTSCLATFISSLRDIGRAAPMLDADVLNAGMTAEGLSKNLISSFL
ncbi:MAG TPA: hypothetical protein VK673_18355, partial [Chthoniobacterales bacterium]|nr:hypothetical protein [Chthoniobacterales bacterium]